LRARLVLAALLVLVGVSAEAQEVTVLRSKSPYWKVGPRDEALSRACSLNLFNLRRPEAYVARFVGPEGYGVLGVAKGTGANLRDPDRKAKPKEDYYFLNHGTTSCEVYVGGRKGRAAG
jgi:hypothetical protein